MNYLKPAHSNKCLKSASSVCAKVKPIHCPRIGFVVAGVGLLVKHLSNWSVHHLSSTNGPFPSFNRGSLSDLRRRNAILRSEQKLGRQDCPGWPAICCSEISPHPATREKRTRTRTRAHTHTLTCTHFSHISHICPWGDALGSRQRHLWPQEEPGCEQLHPSVRAVWSSWKYQRFAEELSVLGTKWDKWSTSMKRSPGGPSRCSMCAHQKAQEKRNKDQGLGTCYGQTPSYQSTLRNISKEMIGICWCYIYMRSIFELTDLSIGSPTQYIYIYDII